MTSNIKITETDLVVGNTLNWAVYDSQGKLLLNKGALIASDKQIQILIQRGTYRQATSSELSQNLLLEEKQNPFDLFYYFAKRLSHLFEGLTQHSENFPARIEKLSKELQVACEKDSDALLGAVHLCHDFSYSIVHSLHIAILCELMAKRLQFDTAHRLSIISAALTSNLGMRTIQDQLQSQAESLSSEQREIINQHPEKGVKLLSRIGVTDKLWLDAILQHHERLDGSGYPKAMQGNTICVEARLIAILDRYSAMITSRSYRDAIHAKDVLKSVFLSRGKQFDEAMSLALIKELGVYPPGAFVRLKNGEVAIVIKRGKDAMQPIVSSVCSPRGGSYANPYRRDCSREDGYKIEQLADRDTSLQLNLSKIWGYA